MGILKVSLTSLFSVIALFVLAKLMGNKQISQMNLFDYTTGITIGSIAAEMATEVDTPFLPLAAMTVYAILAFLLSVLTNHSLTARKIVNGRALVLMNNDKIYRANLKKARLDINDFLALCHLAGYFDISQIQSAVMEQNGGISFLPKEQNRPVSPSDFGLSPRQSDIGTCVISDGRILKENLANSGKDEIWLQKELKNQGYKNEKDIFLGLATGENKLQLYEINNEKKYSDPFE